MSKSWKTCMQINSQYIGPYEVIKSLGKGGMGEVFLVHDALCQRKIALKKILPELASHEVIKQRFLREARFAAQLSHPCIIPVYSINVQDSYYTMPYIEGETLKEIFKATLDKEKKGLSPHELGVSIPGLTRVFLSVCQAMSYAYSKGFLHRDLKPENIMVGKFGEVFLLDWGIASHSDAQELEDAPVLQEDDHLTRPGKVLGTVNFMSPERALKHPASIHSEIYSLGVILYLILTLKYPFVRKNLQNFRKIMKYEVLAAPEEIAPYRDIPKQLSLIAQKCLKADPLERYQSISDLIFDLENYIQGRPEWIFSSSLHMMRKEDWEFQENILLSPQMAISSVLDSLEWVGLMLSKKSFSGNLKLEFDVTISDDHEGIGLLMCVPEPSDRQGLEDGYCLWISGPVEQKLHLYRAGAEILSINNSGLKNNEKTSICIEKIEHSLMVYISGILKLHYTSHIPIVGTHLGLLYKNPEFHLSLLNIFSGSHAVMINCLSIPDAFFASKNFDQAYLDYKKIASSFEGRSEGREAQFRAGLTLLEKGRREKNKTTRESCYEQATKEFEALKHSLAAPLEYLGKSLIYCYEGDHEEEIKCLELVLRKYPHHPLLSIVKEQIIFRLHESSKLDKASAYRFTLLCLMQIPDIFSAASNANLLDTLIKHWPTIHFFNKNISCETSSDRFLATALQLCFLLNKPLLIIELLEKLKPSSCFVHTFEDATLACLHLKQEKLILEFLKEDSLLANATPSLLTLTKFLEAKPNGLAACHWLLDHKSCFREDFLFKLLMYFAKEALYDAEPSDMLSLITNIETLANSKDQRLQYLEIKLATALAFQDMNTVKKDLDNAPENLLKDPQSQLHFLYFCFQTLYSDSKDPHKSWTIFLSSQEKQSSKPFFWEKFQKYQKLRFVYFLTRDEEKFLETQRRLNHLLNNQTSIDI